MRASSRVLGGAVVAAVVLTSVAAASGVAAAVQPPKGVAEPTAGSGMGTNAAMENPRCRTGADYGVYGQFDGVRQGQGPVCVKPWSSRNDNGGATAPGVTADAVRVVIVTPLPS